MWKKRRYHDNEGLMKGKGFLLVGGWFLVLQILVPAPVLADGILDVFERSQAPFNERGVFFPNWAAVPTASFVIMEAADNVYTDCTSSTLMSLTVLNFGTANQSDITGVYMALVCGSKHNTGLLPMTPMGMWTYGADVRAAWTWGGTYEFASNADPCLDPDNGCACEVSLFLYVDVGPCPTDGATVQLGMLLGALVDNCGYSGPPDLDNTDVRDGKIKELRYIVKTVDREEAIPGDTVEYRIYTANPGTVPSQTVVTDTVPLYMHYVSGSSVPAVDAGFDPNMGSLWPKWTLAAPATTVGGATGVDHVQGERGLGERLRLAGWEHGSSGRGAAVEHGAGVLAWCELRDEDVR